MPQRSLLCLLLLSFSSAANADLITTDDGNGADSFVRLGEPTTNFGASSSLLVKNDGLGSITRASYLRFEIPNATFLDAELLLTTSNNDTSGNSTPTTFVGVEVFGLVNETLDLWDESTINWNNAPANVTSNNDFNSDALLLGSFDVEANPLGDTVTFNEAALLDFLNSDTNGLVTLLVRRTDNSRFRNLGFASKENLSLAPPTLNVTTAAVPEPSTWALLSIPVIGFLGYKLRRRSKVTV